MRTGDALEVEATYRDGSPISVRFHTPTRSDRFGNAYLCSYEITGALTLSQFVLGEDAEQAFHLALQVVEATIGCSIPIAALRRAD